MAPQIAAKTSLQNLLQHLSTLSQIDRCSLFSPYFPSSSSALNAPFLPSHHVDTFLSQVGKEGVLALQTPADFLKFPEFQLPPNEKGEQAQSLLLLPVTTRSNRQGADDVIGFLGFESFSPREWGKEDTHLLRVVRDVIQAVLRHQEIFHNFPEELFSLDEEGLGHVLSEKQKGIVSQAVGLFEERLRRPSEIQDRWEEIGRRAFATKVGRCVAYNSPIYLTLPAFPMKSMNQEMKVSGILPDLGEILALTNMNRFAEDVKAFYPPGCCILIVSDGRVFNDLYPVADELVSKYTSCIHTLYKSTNLQFIGLDELFPSQDFQGKRDAMILLYNQPFSSIQAKLQKDPHFLEVYVHFKKSLINDAGFNRSQAASRAKLMMLRNEAYSQLVSLLFPHHIRLSIHDHSGAEKVGVFLVGRSIITPWHGVAVKRRDGTWAIMKKGEAEEIGCVREDALQEVFKELILRAELGMDVELTLQKGALKELPFYRQP